MNQPPTGQIGPHQGQEASLLLTGKKPVAFFSAPYISNQTDQIIKLEQAVATGLLCKAFISSPVTDRTFYCRTEAQAQMQELISIYERLDRMAVGNGADSIIPIEDHRRIGTLLGYAPADIETFLEQERCRQETRRAHNPCPHIDGP